MSTRMAKSTLTALERTDFVIASIRTQKTTVTAALTEALATSLPDGAESDMHQSSSRFIVDNFGDANRYRL